MHTWVKARREGVGCGVIFVAVLLMLIAGWLLWHAANARLGLRFVVPADYTGYLAVRWECPGRLALERNALGGFRDQRVTLDEQGTACIAEPIPSHGYNVMGFADGRGQSLPVIVGGTRSLARETVAGGERFVFSPLASLGVGNVALLGDECTLSDFLEAGFGLPQRNGPCDPIYVLPNQALAATPGMSTGPP